MTKFYRMRTNTAPKRTTTLFVALVRFSAKERRQPMRHGILRTDLGALRFGWRRRTMHRDCWENASIAMRYNTWTKCKRRSVRAPREPAYYLTGQKGFALYRMLHNRADSWNTVYRTRPYRLRRFVCTAHT